MKKIVLQILFVFLAGCSYGQLTVYSGLNLQGTSANCVTDTIFIGSNIPNSLNNTIESISLNRGFMATFAENEDGTGERFTYMATKTNININLAFVLQNKVSFIRVIKLPSFAVKKKGSGNQINSYTTDLKATWFYDWGPFDHSTPATEFVPMMWNAGHASQININATIAKDSLTHLSTFNEPDHAGQAEMTIAESMQPYKDLLRIGQRMGSPACTEGQHRVWLDTFVTRAKEQNLAVDYICDHWYDWGNWLSAGNPNASANDVFNRFKTYINNLYDFHKKPIWLTEFNANVNRLPAVHEAFMALALPWLDANPNVERYAYFFGNDYPVYSSPGVLSPGSVIYANHVSTDANPENVVDTRPSTVSTLASWNPSAILEGGRAVATFAPTFLATNITAPTPLTRGSGVGLPATGSSDGYWGGSSFSTTTAQAGINANEFLTFSLKSNNGKSVNYHSIDKFNIRINVTGPIQYFIDYKVDNGTFRPIDTIKGPTRINGNFQLGPIALHNVPGLQDVPPTSTITFRITPFDASGTGNFLIGSGTFDTDPDLVITGGFSDINPITPTATTADLSALSLSSGSLSPTFAASTNSYRATVSSAIGSITVTPTRANVNATIQVRVNNAAYQNVNSGSPSHTLNLNDGNNTIEILVTGQGGTPVKTYTVTVNRQSNNADLSNLELSTGTASTPNIRPYSPTFAASTTSYTATISGSSSLRVIPTRQNAFSTIHIRINNRDYKQASSGISSDTLTLNFGNNIIDVRVTSQDGSTIKTYTINVLRPSVNADLAGLTINSGSLSPVFSAATTSYTATSTNAATVLVTPTVDEPNATIDIRANSGTYTPATNGVGSTVTIGNISANNTINVRVTAQNGTTIKTYTINIRRLSTNNNLTSLVLSAGTLSPSFATNTTTYTTSVSNTTNSITVTPTSTSSVATIEARVNAESFATVTSGSASNTLNLNIGSNTIEVKVTAEDGIAIRTYTINATRLSSALPVQIADITAKLQTNKMVTVNWTSVTEINLNSYKIQRSNDGRNFTTLGTIASKGAGVYSYTDDLNAVNSLPATIYYRLEAVDNDGTKTYSKIAPCKLQVVDKSLVIYPNPVLTTLFAQVTVVKAGVSEIRVVDVQGKIISTQKTQLATGTTTISIPTIALTPGNYILEIHNADGKQQQRFVKE
jgi:Glycosyl hydrolase catalytic core/Cadherin-like beta sandwich domain/Secretion system C-terminal sorting domain